MEIVKLLIVFGFMVIILTFTRLLPLAVGGAALAAVFLYRLGLMESLVITGKAIISPLTVTSVAAFYLITFLQRMLEKRGHLKKAQTCLDKIFHNARINASLAPVMIGMLPSPGATAIAGAMVEDAAGDSLNGEEKAFVASFFRHITESFFPTFPSIIIATELASQALSSFLVAMIPAAVLMFFLGHVFYLRKIPRKRKPAPEALLPKRRESARGGPGIMGQVFELFRCLWTLMVIVILVTAFRMPVYLAVLAVLLVNVFVDRFTWTELKPMFSSAFEAKLLLSTVAIMIFKDIIAASRVINLMPQVFSRLPVPSFLIYMLIFFLGAVVSGQQGINAVALPMAFASGSGDFPRFVLLMCCGYAAMQISPTHICLLVVIDYFHVSFGGLVKKTLPVVLIFLLLSVAYYFLLEAAIGLF
jgi:integral membrane protein (TIGR00529 family)